MYGVATATGMATIQLLRCAGFTLDVKCSPYSIELVKGYGVEAAFDYKDPKCASKIRAYTKNGLCYALDCIMNRSSMRICYTLLGRAGGHYTTLDPYPGDVAASRKITKAAWVVGLAMLGMDVGWPAPRGRKADADLFKFSMEWKKLVEGLMVKRAIRGTPT
jgi:NADPH:quinone reductase-like Zn-dependent oxidoreductase